MNGTEVFNMETCPVCPVQGIFLMDTGMNYRASIIGVAIILINYSDTRRVLGAQMRTRYFGFFYFYYHIGTYYIPLFSKLTNQKPLLVFLNILNSLCRIKE
uniref:Uncharacterized protein n=1 Tax=Cacopsylla melanoneura TaxID=428564 RepID=A0A8D8TYH8_9HEMI